MRTGVRLEEERGGDLVWGSQGPSISPKAVGVCYSLQDAPSWAPGLGGAAAGLLQTERGHEWTVRAVGRERREVQRDPPEHPRYSYPASRPGGESIFLHLLLCQQHSQNIPASPKAVYTLRERACCVWRRSLLLIPTDSRPVSRGGEGGARITRVRVPVPLHPRDSCQAEQGLLQRLAESPEGSALPRSSRVPAAVPGRGEEGGGLCLSHVSRQAGGRAHGHTRYSDS